MRRECGEAAHGGIDIGDHGEVLRPQAHGDEAQHGLKTFREAAQIVETLGGVGGALLPALLRHDGIGEEGCAGADEGGQQHRSGKSIAWRVAEAEGQWHGGVEQKVERDIEEGTTVGRASQSGDSTIKPIKQTVEQQGTMASQILPCAINTAASMPRAKPVSET